MRRITRNPPMGAPLYRGAAGGIARVIDAVLEVAAPRLVLQRRVARARSSTMLRYEAARRERTRTSGASGSADGDLINVLSDIREASRSLVRDDAHASAAIRVLVENVVGAGLTPQSACRPESTGLSQEQCDEWNNACESVFRQWSRQEADATERACFGELTREVYRGRLVDGEAIAHRVLVPSRIPGRTMRLAWETIDPDRLSDPMRGSQDNVRGGVEIGARGQPIRYWITPQHPDDIRFRRRSFSRNEPQPFRRFVDGFPNILHVFRRERTGQTRGAPALTSALPLFEHLHHYIDSEIIAARANANIAMVVTRPLQADDASVHLDIAGDGERQYLERLEAGTIEYLNEGEDLRSHMPNRPGTTFEPFVVRVLRAIAGSLGVPYELVVKDFGGMNYSSARASLLEAWRGFECERHLLVEQWCDPVYASVITMAILDGALPLPPGYLENPAAFVTARWMSPPRGWVDPVKEIAASRDAIAANLATPQAEAARQGMDAEDILHARARHMRKAIEIEEQWDLPRGSLSGAVAAPQKAAADAGADEDEDPESEDDAQEDDAEDEADENKDDQK